MATHSALRLVLLAPIKVMNDFLLSKQATASLISEQIVAGLTVESQWLVAALNLLNFPNSMALSILNITRTRRGRGVSNMGQ